MLRIEHFGKMPDGRDVSRFVLANENGFEVAVINYAAAIVSFVAPDRGGNLADIVLGFPTLADYLQDSIFMGAIVGRYANRIANARFSLDGQEYQLAANNGRSTLHGGLNGFYRKFWEQKSNDESSVTLTCRSLNGEEGFPGNLSVEVTYRLTDTNELRIDYLGVTDEPTVVNLTSHPYFNLSGAGEGDILQHELLIYADHFLPIDSSSIPTGEIRPVRQTPLDFTRFTRIGDGIGSQDKQVELGSGFDHCWVLRKKKDVNELSVAASLREPASGRTLEVWTTEPGLQFYSGNFLETAAPGKFGRRYQKHQGLCLESQHFPDSPNKPHFPSTILRPGMEYRSTTIYKVLPD